MKRKAIIILLAAAVLCGAGLYIYNEREALLSAATPSVEIPETLIDKTANQIKEIKAIGEWEFLAVDCEVIVERKRERSFFISDDYLVRIYKGCVRIGIDLKDAPRDWIEAEGDSVVYISLPAPHVLDARFIDEADSETFYESGKWDAKTKEEMYKEAEQKMLRLVSRKNYSEAREQARLRFTSLFRALGFNRVIVNFFEEGEGL